MFATKRKVKLLTLSAFPRLLSITALIFLIISVTNSCSFKPKPIPTGQTMTVNLSNFLLSNPYSGSPCYTTQSGSTLIPYEIVIEVNYYTGSGYAYYSSTSYQSTGSNSRNISLSIAIPKDGRTWEMFVTANGRACSLCADTFDGCTQIPVGVVNLRAALPRAQAEYGNTGYLSSVTISSFHQLTNVAASCGCSVTP